jgi:hypothetical protein
VADAIDQRLEAKVFVRGEVADDVFPMLQRRDQQVAWQRRVPREERDREVVTVDDMLVVGLRTWPVGPRQGLQGQLRR